ncbi:MAG TPA: glycosyltransferase [Thermoanaerobaculia bacterium]|jgi:glycosyltransferase involved in cell wall biosynthesis
MRLALLTPGFSASEDDPCIPALLDLVRELAADDDVTVFALRYPHRRRPYDVHGARVVPLGGAQVRGPRRLALYARALAAVLRRRRFDVLHAFWAHEPGFLAGLAGRLSATPVVVSVCGGELVDLPDVDYGGQRRAANRFLVRHALAWAGRVIAGSEYQRRLAELYVDADRLLVLPFGVDVRRFNPGPPSAEARPRLDGDPKLLHVASLSPVKDQATLLRAFALVAARIPDTRLHLVGEGELRAPLEALAAELGVAPLVRFHGEVPHRDLPDVYRQADLCVLSSRSENVAMVALEAAACGCPTVGTAVGVLPDLGGASRTVPPGEPQALGELLAGVLGDRETLAAMAREGLERARSEFALGTSVARLRELYREVLRPGVETI